MLTTFPAECFLKFLTPKDAGAIAKCSKDLRNEVEKNKYTIYVEQVINLELPPGRGNWYYHTEHYTTKQLALKRFDELLEDPKMTLIRVENWFNPMDSQWEFDDPLFEFEWKRE